MEYFVFGAIAITLVLSVALIMCSKDLDREVKKNEALTVEIEKLKWHTHELYKSLSKWKRPRDAKGRFV